MDADRFDDFARNLAEGIRERVARATNAAERRRAAEDDEPTRARAAEDDEPRRVRRDPDDEDRVDGQRRQTEQTAEETGTEETETGGGGGNSGGDDEIDQDAADVIDTDQATTNQDAGDATPDVNPVDEDVADVETGDGGVLDPADFGEDAIVADTGTGVFAISDSGNDVSIASANGVTAISRGDGDEDDDFGDGDEEDDPGDGDDFGFTS